MGDSLPKDGSLDFAFSLPGPWMRMAGPTMAQPGSYHVDEMLIQRKGNTNHEAWLQRAAHFRVTTALHQKK